MNPAPEIFTGWIWNPITARYDFNSVYGARGECVIGDGTLDIFHPGVESSDAIAFTSFLPDLKRHFKAIGLWNIRGNLNAGLIMRHGFQKGTWSDGLTELRGLIWRKGWE